MEEDARGLREYFLAHGFVDRAIILIGSLVSLFVIYMNLGLSLMELWIVKMIVVGGIYTIAFLPYIFSEKEGGITMGIRGFYNLFLLLMGLIPMIYVITQIDRMVIFYGSKWVTADIVFGSIFIVPTLIITRRIFGWAMPSIALIFLAYTLFGNYLPRAYFGHMGFTYARTMSYMFSPAGIFGEIMSVLVKVVFIYLLFGSFLQYSGGTSFMIDFSSGLAGKWRGGPAKIAVISSALMGTISGNSVSNVATTGAVTIPLMKRTGYAPHFAGAVEAVASCGGQILPPIMGSGAFIMAELLSISYTAIIIAATIPAILYFACCLVTVDLEAVRLGLRGLREDEIPNVKKVLRDGGHLFIPVFILVYLLIVSRMAVSRAGLYAIIAIILVSFMRKSTSMNPRKMVAALTDAAKSGIGITVVVATAGLIVGSVGMTGLGTRFSSVILRIADGNFFLVALLTAMICLVLGMGLPTTAAYIIAVSVSSGTMLRIGVTPLATHLFVFYFAAISTITPPVAVAAFTAASLAGAPMIKTGIYASMLGISAYVVPFIFIRSPELLMQGGLFNIILAAITAFFGMTAISMGFEGVCFFGGIRWNWFQRLLLVSSAIWLIIPGLQTDLIGAAIILVVFLTNRRVWELVLGVDRKMAAGK